MRVKASNRDGSFFVTDEADGLSGRAGLGLLSSVADRIGLTDALCDATGHVVDWREHAPGVVLRDLALTLADGGTALRHMSVLDDQQVLFGRVASPATACRTIDAVAADERAMGAIAAARKVARQFVWEAGQAPPVVAAAAAGDPVDEPLVVDLDATLIDAGSDDKDGAAPTYKGGFGFHPIVACLDRGDGTGEALAALLREGNRVAHTAVDNIEVIDLALAQLPDLPDGVSLVVRGDTALATHAVIDRLVDDDIGFSMSYELSDAVRAAIRDVDDDAWIEAVTQDGQMRDGAHVVELTDAVDLPPAWPDSTRLVVRREPLHPGAQQTFDDIDGCRFTAMITDQPDDPVTLDVRHRARAHVEDRIRIAKDTGMRKLPCETFDRNALWLQLVLAALDLTVFTQLLTLDGDLRVAEPVTLRYQLFHVPAKIVRTGRQTFVHLQHSWHWTRQLIDAFTRLDRLLPAAA